MAGAFPKLRGLRAYCDESNTDGRKPHPIYGAILISLNNIKTVKREIKQWRHDNGMHGELKWEKMRGRVRLAKYKSFIDLLIKLSKERRLMHFKAIILDRRAPEYLAYSKGNDEVGFYKFYYHWLLWHFAKFPLRHGCRLRVIIDERSLPADSGDPYKKVFYALNAGVRKELKATRDVILAVHPLGSERSDLLQAADVLMGAIGFHNQGYHLLPTANKEKVELASYVARKIGRRDLTLQTHPLKEHFKIIRWYWPGQSRQRHRRRAADNPRPANRRRNPGS